MLHVKNPMTGQKNSDDGSLPYLGGEHSDSDRLGYERNNFRNRSVVYAAIIITSLVLFFGWCVYAESYGSINSPRFVDELGEADTTTISQRLLEGSFCKGGQRSGLCK